MNKSNNLITKINNLLESTTYNSDLDKIASLETEILSMKENPEFQLKKWNPYFQSANKILSRAQYFYNTIQSKYQVIKREIEHAYISKDNSKLISLLPELEKFISTYKIAKMSQESNAKRKTFDKVESVKIKLANDLKEIMTIKNNLKSAVKKM